MYFFSNLASYFTTSTIFFLHLTLLPRILVPCLNYVPVASASWHTEATVKTRPYSASRPSLAT